MTQGEIQVMGTDSEAVCLGSLISWSFLKLWTLGTLGLLLNMKNYRDISCYLPQKDHMLTN